MTCARSFAWEKSPPREAVEAMLRTAARKVHAEAVIDVRIGEPHVGRTSWGERDGSGKAVRFK